MTGFCWVWCSEGRMRGKASSIILIKGGMSGRVFYLTGRSGSVRGKDFYITELKGLFRVVFLVRGVRGYMNCFGTLPDKLFYLIHLFFLLFRAFILPAVGFLVQTNSK